MIKPSPIKNAAAIGRYFAEETASMRWCGKVADFLEIRGRRVTKYDLSQAAAGYCPLSGRPLYQRHSSNRRLGWDILFMPPKSVSVAALVGVGGDRIIRAHTQAVEATFDLLAEPAAAVSARSALDMHQWHTTEAMLFTHVVHRTNREKDPHIHSHLLVMNTTLDRQTRLMALETGPVFERLGAMERMYNHELSRNLRCEGIRCSVSESGDTIISELEESEEIQCAFSKAHARILKHAPQIAEQIQSQRVKDGLIPLHPKTVGFLSRQIANDRHRPAKEAGIEKSITRSHWRHSIDQASLELIDRCSKPSRALRLRTVRNEKTQSVILPSIVSDLVSEHFPLRKRRSITAIQVMVRCTEKTPDLSAKTILKSALLQCQKISDRSQRKKVEAQIKAGLALAGITSLDAPLPDSKVRVNDPVLTQVLLDRLSPATRRMRLSRKIDRNLERHEERRIVPEPVTLNEALTRHFEQRRRYVYSH
jgi:conjugative relaxase-like TrwC/TraI family protein